MSRARRLLAATAATVLLTGLVAGPAQAVSKISLPETEGPTVFRICDYIPWFPSCRA